MPRPEKWISKAIRKPGALHSALGVPQGKKIPAQMLARSQGDSPKMARRKALARILKKLH